jgi:hypothetical protein
VPYLVSVVLPPAAYMMGMSPGMRGMMGTSPFGKSVDMADMCAQLMAGSTGSEWLGAMESRKAQGCALAVEHQTCSRAIIKPPSFLLVCCRTLSCA